MLLVDRCPVTLFSLYNFFLKSECENAGTTVIATSKDASNAKVIVSANGRNNSPIIPPTNTSGKNTAMVTNVEDNIGLNISIVAELINARPYKGSFLKWSLL